MQSRVMFSIEVSAWYFHTAKTYVKPQGKYEVRAKLIKCVAPHNMSVSCTAAIIHIFLLIGNGSDV